MTYLTLGSLWKDEHDYAEDFIKYHKKVGVEKFIILDREYNKTAEMFKDDPDVTVIHFPEPSVHAEAWAHLISISAGKTNWLALIDADQALVPVQTDDVKDVLKEFEDYASVQMNWHTFGSNGHLKKEPGSVYERFTKRAIDEEVVNNHTQFICQPHRTLALRTADPHHPKLPHNEVSVNTNKEVIQGPFNPNHCFDKLWCAHYINKSLQECEFKHSKGRADIFGEFMPPDLYTRNEAVANKVDEFRVLELWNKI